jgi:hypothetical protein
LDGCLNSGLTIPCQLQQKRKEYKMKLFTQEQYAQLLKNGLPENIDKDKFPVVKLVLPDSNCTWLLTEINPEFPNIAFGLCDLGMGFPELGYVDLEELTDLQNHFRYAVERDFHFTPSYPISVYARAAWANDHIITNPNVLALFQYKPK